MNIKTYDKTIKGLLGSRNQFQIPRFQREYSWEKKHYQEFFEDIINCLTVADKVIFTQPYFLGTMLFIGNYDEISTKPILVVDGQQRMTTITILFSAISDRFRSMEEDGLSKALFSYIMTTDSDNEDVRVLISDSSYPFFSHYIQERDKKEKNKANSDEEELIQASYEYFYNSLDEKYIKTLLSKRHDNHDIENLDYIDILKALRDQILSTTFVSISANDRKQANMIFEILNAKGKHLTSLNLIKNKIFEVLDTTEPADYAKVTWDGIHKTLFDSTTTIGFDTFFRHFWISHYEKTSSNKMYDDFMQLVINNKESTKIKTVKDFLEILNENAKTYVKIVSPKRDDHDNKKQYFWLVQSLNALTDVFNIVQVRVILLALFDLRGNNLIKSKLFKKTIMFLENFHFAYNTIVSGPSNRLESIYSKYAIGFRELKDAEAVGTHVKKLIAELTSLLPSKEEFREKFIHLSFTSKKRQSNLKTKYVLNKLYTIYENNELFPDDGSVEHIISETEGGHTLNIGNLILLECNLNSKAANSPYADKKAIYKESKYAWVKEFIATNDNFNESDISERAQEMADKYYDSIVKPQKQ